jgi:hypothetical protein
MSGRVAVAALTTVLILSGCAARHQDAVERPLVVVLFDVSKSTRDPEIRDRYLSAFSQVVDAVEAEHGRVVGDVIDDNPLAHSSYPIDATFEACDPLTDNKLECDARSTTTRDEVTTAAQQILDGVPAQPGTDIHDGVRLAERVFAAYPEATSCSLVLLSDMVEHSRPLRVGSAGFDGSASLDALAAADVVPDLHGVDVYVVGAGVTSSSDLPATRILAIETFWQGFFTAAGADLPPDRYGAALVRFP